MNIPTDQWMRIQNAIRKLRVEGPPPSDPAEHLEKGIEHLTTQLEAAMKTIRDYRDGKQVIWHA